MDYTKVAGFFLSAGIVAPGAATRAPQTVLNGLLTSGFTADESNNLLVALQAADKTSSPGVGKVTPVAIQMSGFRAPNGQPIVLPLGAVLPGAGSSPSGSGGTSGLPVTLSLGGTRTT